MGELGTTLWGNHWSSDLAAQGLSANTRRKVLGAFHAFLSWLKRRGDLDEIPEFPEDPVDEYARTIISAEAQDAVVYAIPWEHRGAFLAAARLGLRPGEIRALDVSDYHDGWLTMDKAIKGPHANAPTRGAKTRRVRRLPVDAEVREWIDWRLESVTLAERLKKQTPLFPNPTARNPEKR